MLRRKPEAIVLTGGAHSAAARAMLQGDLPVIEIWDLPEAPIGHVVGFDNAAAMARLVDYALAQGLRRIAFSGGEDPRDGRGAARRAGFLAGLAARGAQPADLVPCGAPPVTMRAGAEAMARLLARGTQVDAVFAVSDLVAFGALSECQRRGIAVPEKISVLGFGDYEIASVAVPGLTTVNPFSRRIGEETAALILRGSSLGGASGDR
jgi:LacI family gluconate utilization system Gnt-I transcriptional repressor